MYAWGGRSDLQMQNLLPMQRRFLEARQRLGRCNLPREAIDTGARRARSIGKKNGCETINCLVLEKESARPGEVNNAGVYME